LDGGGAVSIAAVTPATDRHCHLIHRESVAALGLSQLVPDFGGGHGPILGTARHRMFDRLANIVGDVFPAALQPSG
jgi:hypothetical protein